MDSSNKFKNLVLTSYFFHKKNNIFLLKPNENKSTHTLYNETSEAIQIMKILKENDIEFEEDREGNILITDS